MHTTASLANVQAVIGTAGSDAVRVMVAGLMHNFHTTLTAALVCR